MKLRDFLQDREKRESLRALRQLNPWWNLKILVFIGIWVGGAAVALRVDFAALRVACFVLAGASLHALAIFTHEATHGLLFRNRRLNYIVGNLVGIPALVTVTSYRSVHRPHHNYTRTERDPDEFTNAIRHDRLRRLAFLGWLLLGGVIYLGLHVPIMALRLARGRDRLLVLLEYALVAGVFGGAIGFLGHIGRMDVFVLGWAYPAIAAGLLLNVRGVAEHMLTRGDDVFTSTRTVLSNRIIRFFMNNLNYHLEHHLVPSVPWYNLPRLHALLKPDLEKAGAPISRSYVLLLMHAIRLGGTGVINDVRPNASRLGVEAA